MACSAVGPDRDIDTAFDSISDLLRDYSAGDFALSIGRCVSLFTMSLTPRLILHSLKQAKRKDEHKIEIFRYISAKYGLDKVK